jgi:dCMP deaminase
LRVSWVQWSRMTSLLRRVPDWHAYYLAVCRSVALRSKDPHTQIGCVIVGPAHEIRSTGYNSFPRGINDHVSERLRRPEKYLWFEHAERNAIYNAARAGTPLEGCTIYVEVVPCMDCARAIVQAGIVRVVVDADRMRQYSSKRYDSEFKKVKVLFKEARTKMEVVSVDRRP